MYAKSKTYATYYVEKEAKNTDKVFYGRVSEAIKVGEDESGKNKYEFERWDARFVGKAKEKAEHLADGARIALTEWAARNPYNKEKKRSYPYLLVMDFEVAEQGDKK